MIEYSVEGGTRREREIVENAFCFALRELMPRKRNLEVNFTLRNMEENSDGWHLYLGNGEHEIDIQRGLTETELVTAVFHEMVHLRQYERNQLTDNGFTKGWGGEEYIFVWSTIEEYKAFPWEEEAYRLQETLFENFEKSA
tara:strand:+ start:82 stop:504 length:423 start_codon:yes stop_codon:yes gene_type:complete